VAYVRTAAMFETMDQNACELRAYGRGGSGAQYNAVQLALGRVMMRGDARELDGFCAALTGILSISLEYMNPERILNAHADRLQRVARRRERRIAQAVQP
jgi:hypothetical protein